MNVLLLNIGYTEADRPIVSGGDMRWIKMARWLVQEGHQVTVVSTEQCRDLIKRFNLDVQFISVGALGPLNTVGGLRRIWASLRCGLSICPEYDIVCSVTELAYDVIAGRLLKWRRPLLRWGVVCHWVAPVFGRNTKFISAVSFAACDRLGILLSRWADAILCVSRPTYEKLCLMKFLHCGRLHETGCGVDINNATVGNHSGYDAVHIKRVAAAKGSYDVPVIWEKVCRQRDRALLAMYGDGSPGEVQRLNELIKNLGMERSIHYGGPLYDEVAKYELLRSSPVFILPSYEENWAIVIGEALASGMEVVCYDLPDIHPVWGEWVHWVPVRDVETFASVIVGILDGKVAKRNDGKCPMLIPWATVFQKEFKLLEGAA